MKNILIICPFAKPNIGGVESHLEKLIKYLSKNNYKTTLLTYQPLSTRIIGKSYEKNGLNQIYRYQWFGHTLFNKFEKYFPLQFLYLFPGLFIHSLIFYSRNHQKFDCLHAHGLAAALIVKILVKIYPKRSVVSTHAIYHFDKRPILNKFVLFILKDFDKILAVSEVSKLELLKMGLSPTKIEVHPNWIDTDIYRPQASKTIFQHKFNLLFVGRLIESKGIKLILQIASKLPQTGFHIVGSGDLEADVKRSAQAYPNVFYYGSLSTQNPEQFQQLLNLYSSVDYFLSPYLYDEGFSTTLIESLSCGTPLIVPKRGSPPTFLNDSVAVFLPYLPTKINLTATISKLSSVPTALSLRKLCRNYAQSNFSDKNAEIIKNSYST